MKCTKLGVLTALGLLTLTGLTAVLFVSAADSVVDIRDDIKNAVQHIGSVKFVNTANNIDVTLSQQGAGQVGINTNNFLIIKSGDSAKIKGTSAASSILGGIKNSVNNSQNATILAGSGNQLSSANNSIIVGGIGNISSSSSNSAIIGGSNNTINSSSNSSIIVGGELNTIKGKSSAILGKNNNLTGNNSVALGQNSKLNASQSFLWTDGSYTNELSSNGVFAVVSEGGMVVNTDTRNPLARLTIGGSLVVGENIDKNAKVDCGGGTSGKGILKLVSKNDGSNQSCLCSCDGYTWNSLYGNGKCASVCNDKMSPECDSALSKIYLTETEFVYSGSCKEGVVIPKSYYVEGETIYWYCQTSDGAISDKCSANSSDVEIIETICYPSTSSCGKGYKTGGTAWKPGYTCELGDKKEDCNCPDGEVWDGNACVPINTRGGVCNNGVSEPSKDGCNIGNYRIKGNTNGTTWNCWDAGFKTTYNESLCYSCDENSVWDGNGCKKQSDICKPSSSSCIAGYTKTGGALWGYNYYCKKSGSSDVECTCPSGKIWNGSSCVSITSICNNSATNPSTAGCSFGNYANVSEENGYVWNCKDAKGDNLNGNNVCHKCDDDSTWNGERCVKKGDVCGQLNCGDDYELSGGVVWGYNYYCNKEGFESLTCNCDLGKIWNGATCVSMGETPCNPGASDVTQNGCYQGTYSGVQITNGYKWDCLDASGTILNSGGVVCYKCNNGFSWDETSEQCVEIQDGKCTLSDTQHTVLASGQSISMYYDSEMYCPSTCQSHVVTQCINGVISGSTNPWAEYEEYCDTYGVLCTEATLDTCPEHGKCNACTGYTVNNNVCTTGDVKRYLSSCDPGYKKYGNTCVSTKDYACLSGGGTWTINKNAEEAGYALGNGYYDSDWRIIEEGIEPYYKTGTCGNTISCSSKGYSCGGTFVPKQQYRRSYTIYAEHYADYHQCSNNSSLNYYTVSEDEDGNEVYVEEDDDYVDATHQHGECGSNASEVCWDEGDGLYYATDNNGIAWYSTGSNGLRLLCENYGWDCTTGAQHPINCDTCFFEVENLGKVSDGSAYGNPGRCDVVLPSSYMENNGVVDCGYRGRDIYCWNGSDLMHYSGVWGTESPRDPDGYAHTHIDTRYCGGAHGHKVGTSPTSYLCMRGTSSTVQNQGTYYSWSCGYGGISSMCWACLRGTEEECWTSRPASCPSGMYVNGNGECECPTGKEWNGTTCVEPSRGGDSGSQGEECSEDKEFNPSWALYCGSSPDESSSMDRQCESDASSLYGGAGWSCSYNNSCPGRAPMCECTRTYQCKSCAKSGGCSATNHGGTCTTYSSDLPAGACTSITSTCNDGEWSKTPYQYSSCTRGCEKSNGCSAAKNGSTCTTYSINTSDSCNSYKTTSTCNNGTWSNTPYKYSSCSKCSEEKEFNPSWALYCDTAPNESSSLDRQCESDAGGAGWSCSYNNSCPGRAPMCECFREVQCQSCSASGGCPTTTHGGTCTTYYSTSPVGQQCSSRTSTCDNGEWSVQPYGYNHCTPGCPTLLGCSLAAHGFTCETYSTDSSYSCDNYKTTSTCNAGTWSPTPFTYQYCSAPTGSKGGCFLAGTQVYMADGTTKNIEDIEAGDMVMTYNTASGKIEYHRVLRPLVHENNNDELYELTINGEVLKVTEVHNFYITRDGFEENGENQCTSPYRRTMAKELQVGDKILMNDGTQAEIENITHHSNYGTVYNLAIEDVHTYFVGEGYLVHNELSKASLNTNDGDPADDLTSGDPADRSRWH